MRAARASMTVALAAALAAMGTATHAASPIDGEWAVDAPLPADTTRPCPGFLPPGSRVRLAVDAAPAASAEEAGRKQYAARLTLLAPLSPALCALEIGKPFADLPGMCDAGQLKGDAAAPADVPEARVEFHRLNGADIASGSFDFYTAQGAQRGAAFALLYLGTRGIDWELWQAAPDRLVAQCTVRRPGEPPVIESVPMTWRRVGG